MSDTNAAPDPEVVEMADTTAADATADATAPRGRRGKRVVALLGLAALGALISSIVRKNSAPREDPWATPDISAYTPPETGRAATVPEEPAVAQDAASIEEPVAEPVAEPVDDPVAPDAASQDDTTAAKTSAPPVKKAAAPRKRAASSRTVKATAPEPVIDAAPDGQEPMA